VSPRELLDAWQLHSAALVNARHGIGEFGPEPAGRLRGSALDALVCGQALADQLMRMRWVTALDALTYGASLFDVAAALGLMAHEVAAGLRSWADGQLRLNRETGGKLGISPAEHDAVNALLRRDQ
jgi:hypothetical protein